MKRTSAVFRRGRAAVVAPDDLIMHAHLAIVIAAALRGPAPTPNGASRRQTLLAVTGATAAVLRHPSPVAAFTEEDYQRDPADISRAVLPEFSQRDVFLHFHGRGGPDREDADLKARILEQDQAAGLDRFVHVFVWREWLEAASTERISYTGQAIGRKIGTSLAQRTDLRSLHVCGTSAGGFAANECVSAYVAAAGEKRATTRLTLCDPFCARADEVGSPWDDGLGTPGAKLFGRDADFAEHYLNVTSHGILASNCIHPSHAVTRVMSLRIACRPQTDDIVPSTNFPLPLCHVYDVTGARTRAAFPPPDTGNFFQNIGLRLLGYHVSRCNRTRWHAPSCRIPNRDLSRLDSLVSSELAHRLSGAQL